MKMLKNSKSINFIYKNKNQKNSGEDKFPLKYQNYLPKQYQKKEIKCKKSDSTIKFKNSEIINNKQLLLAKRYTMRNKYHKVDKINENKEKSNTKRLSKGNSSYKNLKNPINGKENSDNFNCFSGRKSSLPKQISFVSKVYIDNLPRTIDNDNNDSKFNKDKKNKEKKYGKNLRQSNFQNIKQNKVVNKKSNIINPIYDYQINQLKQIIMKQNIDNCIEKILSNKLKNKNANNKNKLNNTFKNTNNNDSNIYLTSFSPPQKNNIIYKMSSNSKTSIFSNTNPSINYNSETNTTNTHANNFKSLNNNNIYIEDKKHLLTNKSPNKKTSEKSCPSFNIYSNSTKNIIDSYIIEGNFSKNCSSSNLILRKTAGPCLNSIKGALRPFCSLITIPINNKIKKDKNKDNFNSSNENVNYIFDKDKYFNEFKNRMNLNINNLFFKTKRKKWKNMIQNKSKIHEKQDIIDRKENFLSEESNNNEFFYNNNERRNSALLTEKINKNDKIVKIKKLKTINLNNNSNNKNYNINKEDFILNDIFLKKRRARKRLSDTDTDTESNHINLTNFVYAKNKNNKNYNIINNKSSFISFNRRTVNENINFNYNSNFSNCNSNNNKGRNAYNILHNNFFEPQTTIVNKKNKNSNRIINSNSNRNNYTQSKNKDNKSLTIQNIKEKSEGKNVIKSSRNKNIVNEIFGRVNKETYYLRIINELNKYKKEKIARKKELDSCFLNNSNNNKVNNITNNNNNSDMNKKKKENKQKIIVEIDENKIKENISQNTLSMYTIYILSKYYPHCSKMGLSKITLFDKNGNVIPIICSNTNSNSNKWKNVELANLFNSVMTNNSLSNENKNKDFPFIMEYKKNIYINFYIKNVKTNNIDYIQINNYSDLKNEISPVKNIHIFKGNKMIYKGMLSEKNNINKIYLNVINDKICSNIINASKNINKDENKVKQRPLSSTKPRGIHNIQITKVSTNRKNEAEECYTKKNIFNKSNYKGYLYNEKVNNKSHGQSDKKNRINDLRNSKLLSGNLKQQLNISNTYTINNITNNLQKTFYEIGERYSNQYNDENSESNNNKNIEEKLFYNPNNINYNSHESNVYKKYSYNVINEYDNNNTKKEKEEKRFFKSNSEKKFKKSIIKTHKSLLFQKINEENNDIKFNDFNNYTYFNSNRTPSNYNYTLYKNNLKSNINNNIMNYHKKYIEFNKICFILTSNYGHSKYIGLTGIEFYNLKGDLINIEKAVSIGALPKDLKTIYEDNDENRIFENVFNNINNTNDIENMWVTKFRKIPPLTFIEICFEDRIKISRIKIFNYNEKNKLEIGVKTIDLYLDDKFYKTILIRQGTGEIAFDHITLNNDNNCSNEEIEINKNYDFGQNITFPIIDEFIYNNSYLDENQSSKKYEYNNINYHIKNNLDDEIKYASYLYEQSYETPYLPCGYYVQFHFCSNYYKGMSLKEDLDSFKYKNMGLNNIEIFDTKGINVLSSNNFPDYKYKILSNYEIFNKEDGKIILNGTENDNNNSIFYVFEKNIEISYIKFYPLTSTQNNEEIKSLNSVKEIKIYCEKNIIFEGDLYLDKPTIVLFTCDSNIQKNINVNYLTKCNKNRECKEILKEEYFSLLLN